MILAKHFFCQQVYLAKKKSQKKPSNNLVWQNVFPKTFSAENQNSWQELYFAPPSRKYLFLYNSYPLNHKVEVLYQSKCTEQFHHFKHLISLYTQLSLVVCTIHIADARALHGHPYDLVWCFLNPSQFTYGGAKYANIYSFQTSAHEDTLPYLTFALDLGVVFYI